MKLSLIIIIILWLPWLPFSRIVWGALSDWDVPHSAAPLQSAMSCQGFFFWWTLNAEAKAVHATQGGDKNHVLVDFSAVSRFAATPSFVIWLMSNTSWTTLTASGCSQTVATTLAPPGVGIGPTRWTSGWAWLWMTPSLQKAWLKCSRVGSYEVGRRRRFHFRTSIMLLRCMRNLSYMIPDGSVCFHRIPYDFTGTRTHTDIYICNII